MSFSNMLEILQKMNEGRIVMINAGIFYIATGKDAVILNKELGLKCTCFTNYMCKVGVPINSIEKYLQKLEKMKYGYIVYHYDKNQNKLAKIFDKDGKKNLNEDKNINCLLCKGAGYFKEDEYMIALKKYLDEAREGKK